MDKVRDSVEKYILLSIIPGFGVVSQNRLLNLCGDIDNCFMFSPEELRRRNGISGHNHRIELKRLETFVNLRGSQTIKDSAKRIIENCSYKGVKVVTAIDPEYPERFKGLTDMPIALYIRGDLRINEFSRSVGVVGARRCSAEGKGRTIACTENELKAGSAIISGMAKGIDSYAHTAAVKNGGYTIAVLGNGPDICYPKEHERLYEEIIDHGCILSEYPPGTAPRSHMFPKRNRLIAALSDMVYVIDTGRHSGTDTTVAACEKYGRIVRHSLEEILS